MWTHSGEAEQQVESRRENRDKMRIKYSDISCFHSSCPPFPREYQKNHKSDRKEINREKDYTLKIIWYLVVAQ